jgi:hypothetical protein
MKQLGKCFRGIIMGWGAVDCVELLNLLLSPVIIFYPEISNRMNPPPVPIQKNR